MNFIPLGGQHGVFVINVFTVPSENQQALVDAIRADGEGAAVPGLLSRHLLSAADGTQVAHCMHWASEDAFRQAVATNQVISKIKDRVHELGARPASFEVTSIA